jgi:hypothetical protein
VFGPFRFLPTFDSGQVLGWPIYLCFMIVTANVYAVLAGAPVSINLGSSDDGPGEWKGTSRQPKVLMAGGLGVLLVAVVVIAVGAI